MSIQLTERVLNLQPSATMAVAAKAREMKAAGKDVIGLGAGEPDFDTPEHIKQAGIDAINNGFTNYTAAEGMPELKEAVCRKLKRENSLEYKPEQIIASVGAKHSIYNVLQALVGEGDEVIVPAPYWVSYTDMVSMTGGVPVIVSAGINQSFKITPEQIERAITDKTKLLIMNSPSNPTGLAFSKDELAALGEVLERHPKVCVVTDDIYEHILWTEAPFCNIVNACPALHDRTIVVNGLSKAYAMTGWRIGYAAGPVEVISAMRKVQMQSTSNPTSITQMAAITALDGDQACIVPMVKAFKERHDLVVSRLNELNGVRCLNSDGTFYAFPDFSAAIDDLPKVANDTDLAAYILDTVGVALVPGTAFGGPGHLRISYATDTDTLTDALDRLARLFPS